MKKAAYMGIGLALLLLLTLVTTSSGALQDKPKYSIREVMQKAHKTGLWKKVAEGKATEAERKELVEYYTSLSQQKPPKGDLELWRKRTSTMLKIAQAAEKGDKGEAAKLLKTVNCKDCHGTFRD
ncbi:MAG TPA: hypothetical protein VNK04_01130 [Gemmataceae bacterium]|jgi:hypothetical protein|nr:hypothetical protein [Gemmataceae bacterium]